MVEVKTPHNTQCTHITYATSVQFVIKEREKTCFSSFRALDFPTFQTITVLIMYVESKGIVVLLLVRLKTLVNYIF